MPQQLTQALVHEIVDFMMQMRGQLWIVKDDIKTARLAILAQQICAKLASIPWLVSIHHQIFESVLRETMIPASVLLP